MGCVTRADLFLDVDQKTSSLITHKNRSKKCLTMRRTGELTTLPSGRILLTYHTWRLTGGGVGDIVCIRRYTPHYSVDTGLVGKCAVLSWLISINIYCTNRQEMAVI
eukprot:scaffold20996_cov72-Skeletonema_menzelii.AAC.1